jgi:outer membrane murein-binding lipoprotein Lpp
MTHTLRRLTFTVGAGASAVVILGGASAATHHVADATAVAIASARIDMLERRIETLERALEAAQATNTVKAPFTVVDGANHPIFRVDAGPRGFILFDETGARRVSALAAAGGGTIQAMDPAGASVALNATPEYGNLQIRDRATAGLARVTLGYRDKSINELLLADAAMKKVVRLSNGPSGGSRLDLSTADERRVASLIAEPGKAAVALQDAPGGNRASLSLDPDGSSEFLLTDPARKPAASMIGSTLGGNFTVYQKGSPVVLVEATTDGAIISARSADDGHNATLSAGKDGSEISVRDGLAPQNHRAGLVLKMDTTEIALWNAGHKELVRLSPQAEGGGGLITFYDSEGHPLASSGAAKLGGFFKAVNAADTREAAMGIAGEDAIVTMRDGPGKPRATLALPADGMPALVILNATHTGVAVFGQAAHGGGAFQLRDHSGQNTVEGGTLENGHGIVRAGPTFQCAGTFAGLIAPDCIMGKKK